MMPPKPPIITETKYKTIVNSPLRIQSISNKLFEEGWIPLREYIITDLPNNEGTEIMMILQRPETSNDH